MNVKGENLTPSSWLKGWMKYFISFFHLKNVFKEKKDIFQKITSHSCPLCKGKTLRTCESPWLRILNKSSYHFQARSKDLNAKENINFCNAPLPPELPFG